MNLQNGIELVRTPYDAGARLFLIVWNRDTTPHALSRLNSSIEFGLLEELCLFRECLAHIENTRPVHRIWVFGGHPRRHGDLDGDGALLVLIGRFSSVNRATASMGVPTIDSGKTVPTILLLLSDVGSRSLARAVTLSSPVAMSSRVSYSRRPFTTLSRQIRWKSIGSAIADALDPGRHLAGPPIAGRCRRRTIAPIRPLILGGDARPISPDLMGPIRVLHSSTQGHAPLLILSVRNRGSIIRGATDCLPSRISDLAEPRSRHLRHF